MHRVLRSYIPSPKGHPIPNRQYPIPTTSYPNTMTDLTNIFPTNYPDRPSTEDLEIMFQDILNRSDSVLKVVSKIEKESCPYYQEAPVRLLAQRLPTWYNTQDPIAGIDYGDHWIPYWQEPQRIIRELIDKYQALQNTLPVSMPIAAPVEKIVRHVQQSVQQTIKQAVQQAVKDIVVSPAQPIIIHNLTINYYNAPVHNYNAPIGQNGNTTITGLDNLIQDNHGTMNF